MPFGVYFRAGVTLRILGEKNDGNPSKFPSENMHSYQCQWHLNIDGSRTSLHYHDRPVEPGLGITIHFWSRSVRRASPFCVDFYRDFLVPDSDHHCWQKVGKVNQFNSCRTSFSTRGQLISHNSYCSPLSSIMICFLLVPSSNNNIIHARARYPGTSQCILQYVSIIFWDTRYRGRSSFIR